MRPLLVTLTILAAVGSGLGRAQSGVETALTLGLRYDADLSGSLGISARLAAGGPLVSASVLVPAALEFGFAWRFTFPEPDPGAPWLTWFAAGLVLNASLAGGRVQLGPAAWFGVAYRLSDLVQVEATFDIWIRPFPARGEYRLGFGPVLAW